MAVALALVAGCAPEPRRNSGGSSTKTEALLQVRPITGLLASGVAGGPVAPASIDYELRNGGDKRLDWSLFATESWVDFSLPSGSLDAGQSVTVTLSIDQAEVASFGPGIFPAVIDFQNDTNGAGSTPRSVELDVQAHAQQILVTPDEAFEPSGNAGGPFTPDQKTYALENVAATDVDWSVSPTVPWIDVAPASGTLLQGETVQVLVQVDQALAAALGIGSFAGDVVFSDLTAGVEAQRIDVSLAVQSVGGFVDVLSQHGITWTFDREHEVGQYANGDYWVIGPLTITDIEPRSVSLGGRVVHGSTLNPSPREGGQGYDSDMFGPYKSQGSYNPELNVALGVSPAEPLVLPAGFSLVSSVSHATSGARPQLESAAILTVVGAAQPPGSFRPPYSGTDKTARWNVSRLDRSKLAKLPRLPSTPQIVRVTKQFERPWIDHIPDWIGRYHHPVQNMPDYGREMADEVGHASLLLNMDFTDQDKELLLVRLVQVGIDFWGIVLDGGEDNWPAGGGHHSGRKWAILFAGLMLDDPDMAAIGFDPTVAFNEDDQTFYVQETSPGVYNNGFGGYGSQHVGLAEWGNQHAKSRAQDDVRWFGNPYRTCCTANAWWGEVLAARIMGAQALWNHDPLFDYMDRYREVSEIIGQAAWQTSWSPFPLEMWDAYRADF